MNPNEIELWLSVPETDHRFEVSNFGHLRQMARNVRRGKTTIRVQDVKRKPLMTRFSTGELGWQLFFDGEERFFARDGLMAMFPEAVLAIDHSADESLKARWNEAQRDYEERHGKPYTPAERVWAALN